MEWIGIKSDRRGTKSRVKLWEENEAEEVDVITADTRTLHNKNRSTIKYVHHIWLPVRTAS